MLRTAPTTGITMCEIAVAIEERRETACGYKETSDMLSRDVGFPLVSRRWRCDFPEFGGCLGNVGL